MKKKVTSKNSTNKIYRMGYKPEYCEMIIRHSEEGGNIEEFAAKINVHKRRLSYWSNEYPEFRQAKETAKLKYIAYWVELRRKFVQRKFKYTRFLFLMIGAFGYQNPHRPSKPET